MTRVTAGEAFALVYDVASSGETYTATVIDPQGRRMDSTVTESAPNVTVTVAYDAWNGGQAGHGRVEIRREDTKAIVKRDRFRVLGGLNVSQQITDYLS
jgi:hypothetical protein